MKEKEKEDDIHVYPHNCITCKHWVSKGEAQEREWVDIFSGYCLNNGVQCGPMWTCKVWEYGRMKVKPKIED